VLCELQFNGVAETDGSSARERSPDGRYLGWIRMPQDDSTAPAVEIDDLTARSIKYSCILGRWEKRRYPD